MRISVPVGTYVPVFEVARREEPSADPAPTAETPQAAGPGRRGYWVAAGLILLVAAAGMYFAAKSKPVSLADSPRPPARTFKAYPVLSPDGRWLIYSASDTDDGELQLWKEEVATKERRLLTKSRCPKISPTISADGNWLAFRAECDPGGIYLLPLNGEWQERLIGHYGRDPAFSPDGKSLVYWVRDARSRFGRVFVAPLDHAVEPAAFAREFDDSHTPIFTPDGKNVVICGTRRSAAGPSEEHDFWLLSAPKEGMQSNDPARKLGILPELEKMGLNPHPEVLSSAKFAWEGRDLIFSAASGGNTKLWRLRFNATWKLAEPPAPLPGPEGDLMHASASDAHLAFSRIRSTENIWEVPMDHATAKSSGALRKLAVSGSLSPSVSADGKTMVFLGKATSSHYSLWTIDPQSGVPNVLAAPPNSIRRLKLSRDGKTAYYRVLEPSGGGNLQAIYAADLATGKSTRVCADCGAPTSVTPDGSMVIFETANTNNRLGAVRVAKGEKWEFLQHPHHALLSGEVSTDGRWIAFSADEGLDGQHIFIAPFSKAAPISRENWIPINQSGARNEFPQWSPDGTTIYFLSDIDGWRCIWAQRINPANGLPAGKANPAHHFHDFHLNPFRLSNMPTHLIGFSVVLDKAVLSLLETETSVELTPRM